jgi:hypothetical protein
MPVVAVQSRGGQLQTRDLDAQEGRCGTHYSAEHEPIGHGPCGDSENVRSPSPPDVVRAGIFPIATHTLTSSLTALGSVLRSSAPRDLVQSGLDDVS